MALEGTPGHMKRKSMGAQMPEPKTCRAQAIGRASEPLEEKILHARKAWLQVVSMISMMERALNSTQQQDENYGLFRGAIQGAKGFHTMPVARFCANYF